MHELTLAHSVIELLENQARTHQFHQVNQVWLTIGAMACVEVEALRTGLEAACRHTLAEGARFHIDIAPVQGWCFSCNAPFTARHSQESGCPHCGSAQVKLQGGDEMRVREVDVM